MQGPVLSALVDKVDCDKIDARMQSKNNGIISNSFEHLFEAISVTTDIRYLVLVSYYTFFMEIVTTGFFTKIFQEKILYCFF